MTDRPMKGLVIGFGSIGQRHVRIMSELGIGVAVVSRRDVPYSPVFSNTPEALCEFSPDYVVIASQTHEHREDIQMLSASEFTGKLLIEKPLYAEKNESQDFDFSSTKIAYNLRFHPALQLFRRIVSERQVYAVHAYTGSYLPEWRPGTDYRQSYSAKQDMGGGVLRDLSHEIDFLLWTFGSCIRLTAMGGHFSDLEIDADDVFSLLFETAQAPLVSLQLNYLDTTPTRNVIALTDQGSVRLDLIAGSVETTTDTLKFSIHADDTYRSQHQAMLADDSSIICSFEEGLNVVRMIDASVVAAKTRTWVNQ